MRRLSTHTSTAGFLAQADSMRCLRFSTRCVVAFRAVSEPLRVSCPALNQPRCARTERRSVSRRSEKTVPSREQCMRAIATRLSGVGSAHISRACSSGRIDCRMTRSRAANSPLAARRRMCRNRQPNRRSAPFCKPAPRHSRMIDEDALIVCALANTAHRRKVRRRSFPHDYASTGCALSGAAMIVY